MSRYQCGTFLWKMYTYLCTPKATPFIGSTPDTPVQQHRQQQSIKINDAVQTAKYPELQQGPILHLLLSPDNPLYIMAFESRCEAGVFGPVMLLDNYGDTCDDVRRSMEAEQKACGCWLLGTCRRSCRLWPLLYCGRCQ